MIFTLPYLTFAASRMPSAEAASFRPSARRK